MNNNKEFDKFSLQVLTKQIAEKHATELASLADLIPQVTYTEQEILAESKGKRILFGKWDHSLVLFDGDKPIAVLIAYERMSEENDQYPQNTIYLSELAVDKNYQGKGIAKKLLGNFLVKNNKVGMKHLDGNLNYSVQTNSADWNIHVQNLYKSFGFTQRTTKNYEDRMDVILGLKA